MTRIPHKIVNDPSNAVQIRPMLVLRLRIITCIWMRAPYVGPDAIYENDLSRFPNPLLIKMP